MRPGVTIALTAVDRRRLGAIVGNRNVPQKHAWRAERGWAATAVCLELSTGTSVMRQAEIQRHRRRGNRHIYASHLVSSGLILEIIGRLRGEARLSISDNGKGIDSSQPTGSGTRLIKSLAAQIGGQVRGFFACSCCYPHLRARRLGCL